MQYDVIIVGAGPAGSTSAKFLGEKGLNVLLLDKQKFPRDKACGGGIPVKIFERFNYIRDYDLVESYTYGGYAHSPSLKYKVKVVGDKPYVAMVLRKKFDNGLVKIALENGVKFYDNKKIVDVKIFEDNVKIVTNKNEIFNSKCIIGADGVWSIVGNKTGLIKKHRRIGICVYDEYKISKEIINDYFTDKHIGHLHIKIFDLNGYGWIFPKKNHINIGIGEIGKSDFNLKNIFSKYIQLLKKDNIIPESINIRSIKGGALPIHPVEKTYSNRVILCGDSAGFINPLTGEGIDYAMYSGKIASEVLIKAFEKENFSERFFKKYEKLWKKSFGKDLLYYMDTAKKWNVDNEELFEIVSKDNVLSNLLMDIATGNRKISEIKGKIIRRYLKIKIKNIFKHS